MGPVIGVDLGATNIRAAAVDEGGRCGAVHKQRVPEGAQPEAVARAVAELCQAASGPAPSPRAVGVGLAGWMDEGRGWVHNGPNLGWREVPFGEQLSTTLGGPAVVLTNDLRAIAWGEYLHGAGAGAQVLLVVFHGSGIGSAVIVDGVPLRGASGVAGELGHVRVVTGGGRACGCGQIGCLEAYVGGHNLERRVRHDIETGAVTSLRERRPEAITCDVIDRAAASGDGYALALWEEAAGFLGQALGSMITYLNPDCLILGGGVWAGAATLRALADERLRRAASPEALDRCQLCEPDLSDRAGMIGAAALARQQL